MRLRYLEVSNLRVVEAAVLTPGPDTNLILGGNGSGKSSLLEAIHLLGTGRSFRTRAAQPLIRHGEGSLMVHGRVRSPDGEDFPLGVEKTPRSTRIRLDEEGIRNAATLARRLPVLLVPPDSQRLLTDGAALRRRLVDWGLFHVEPRYAEVYQGYRRVLQQRNAQLRESPSTHALAPWNAELQQAGEQLHRLRVHHLKDMLPGVASLIGELVSLKVSIHFEQGWDLSVDLGQALHRNTARDLARGHTTVGPHRADLGFTVAGERAQDRLSRGEAKLFCLGIWLAQAADVHGRTGRMPLILVDDLAAELDLDSRRKVSRALTALGAQSFVTGVSKAALEGIFEGQKSFHVERGKVTEMV